MPRLGDGSLFGPWTFTSLLKWTSGVDNFLLYIAYTTGRWTRVKRAPCGWWLRALSGADGAEGANGAKRIAIVGQSVLEGLRWIVKLRVPLSLCPWAAGFPVFSPAQPSGEEEVWEGRSPALVGASDGLKCLAVYCNSSIVWSSIQRVDKSWMRADSSGREQAGQRRLNLSAPP